MMKQGSSPLVSSLTMLVVVLLVFTSVKMSGAALSPTPSQCMEERRLGVNACKTIVFGQPPSAACCERVRVTHFECVCPVVTPKLAAIINVNRAVSILNRCGRRVPRHFKCGSLSFP